LKIYRFLKLNWIGFIKNLENRAGFKIPGQIIKRGDEIMNETSFINGQFPILATVFKCYKGVMKQNRSQ
jgi:hypothetical protein